MYAGLASHPFPIREDSHRLVWEYYLEGLASIDQKLLLMEAFGADRVSRRSRTSTAPTLVGVVRSPTNDAVRHDLSTMPTLRFPANGPIASRRIFLTFS